MRTVKTDFLISPAYSVLPMRQSRWSKLSVMNVCAFVPSIGGKPWKPGAAMTVNSGTWRRYSSSDSREDEHVPHEEAVPRLLRDDPDRDAVGGVGAGVDVLDEEVAPLQVALEAVEEVVELLGGVGAVVLTPPDVPFGRGFLHDGLVVRGAAGVLAGVGDDGAARDDARLAAEGDLLVEGLGGEVPVDHPQVREPVVGEAVVGLPRRGLALGRGLDVEQVLHSQSLTSFLSPT